VLQEGQLLVLGGSFALLLFVESLAPLRATSWRMRLRHVARNAGLWLVSTFVLSLVTGTALIGLAVWLESHRIGLFHFVALPTWAVFVGGFLALDFGDYVFHRLSHQWRWLWLMHAVHHSDVDVDVSTNLRAHPGHVLATAISKPLVLAAFGIPLWVWMARELISIPVTQLQHSAVRLPAPLERMLRLAIVTPGLHRIHHSPLPQETNSNYGGVVPWWDRLLGTFRGERAHSQPLDCGLDALRDDRWQTLIGMLRTPISARRFETL
jgi:sterol desaturase/sphingolipid hydroxylase (fatty acid hydroxylase superfamily)